MNEAMKLAEEMQRYGVTTMNRWATDGAAMLRSQHAEIEDWKNDQKENLKNQCDLHAEIERCHGLLITLAAKEADNLHQAFTLRTENRELREALENVSNMSEELSISRYARAALGETK